MVMTNYKKSYSILGVFQDDDWETVRNAYKRLIRRWHPDRFQDPDQRKIAEAKCKEINIAYQMLDEYYRQAGTLPPEYPVMHESPPSMDDAVSEHTHTPATESTKVDPFQDAHVHGREPAGRNYTTILIIIAAIAIGYITFSEPLLIEHLNAPEIALAGFEESHPTPNNSAMNKSTAAMPARTDTHDNTEGTQGEWKESAKGAARGSTPTTGRLPYITHGSTKQDVLAIQGRPLRETDTAWDYGLSRINFQNDIVTDWYENPMNPLVVQR